MFSHDQYFKTSVILITSYDIYGITTVFVGHSFMIGKCYSMTMCLLSDPELQSLFCLEALLSGLSNVQLGVTKTCDTL